MAILFAESIELPPPKPITKSQLLSLAILAPSVTCSDIGLERILSNRTV